MLPLTDPPSWAKETPSRARSCQVERSEATRRRRSKRRSRRTERHSRSNRAASRFSCRTASIGSELSVKPTGKISVASPVPQLVFGRRGGGKDFGLAGSRSRLPRACGPRSQKQLVFVVAARAERD